jgi:hypothetical protein
VCVGVFEGCGWGLGREEVWGHGEIEHFAEFARFCCNGSYIPASSMTIFAFLLYVLYRHGGAGMEHTDLSLDRIFGELYIGF